MIKDLEYYIGCFAKLHTATVKGKKAPHKAIFLISIMELIEMGVITSPEIELSEDLCTSFKYWWTHYVKSDSGFTADIGKPFFHMQHEPFWNLVESSKVGMAAERIELRSKKELPKGNSYSVKTLRESFCYANIDNELFTIMLNADNRIELRKVLLQTYLFGDTNSKTGFKKVGIITPLLFLLAS